MSKAPEPSKRPQRQPPHDTKAARARGRGAPVAPPATRPRAANGAAAAAAAPPSSTPTAKPSDAGITLWDVIAKQQQKKKAAAAAAAASTSSTSKTSSSRAKRPLLARSIRFEHESTRKGRRVLNPNTAAAERFIVRRGKEREIPKVRVRSAAVSTIIHPH